VGGCSRWGSKQGDNREQEWADAPGGARGTDRRSLLNSVGGMFWRNVLVCERHRSNDVLFRKWLDACVFERCDLEGNGDNELCVQGRGGYSKRVGNTKRVTLCRVVVLTRWICVCKASCV
jgi:hypothetical protein